MAKKKRTKKVKKPRDLTILAAFKNEINLKTQVQEDKTKYNRKKYNSNKEEY